jgi:hypothetical protein
MKCLVILAVLVLATFQLAAEPANALTPTQSAASAAKAKAQSDSRAKAQAAAKARTDALARANSATAAKAKALEAAKLGIRNETKSRAEAAEKAARAQIGLKSARTEPGGQTLGNLGNHGKPFAVQPQHAPGQAQFTQRTLRNNLSSHGAPSHGAPSHPAPSHAK